MSWTVPLLVVLCVLMTVGVLFVYRAPLQACLQTATKSGEQDQQDQQELSALLRSDPFGDGIAAKV